MSTQPNTSGEFVHLSQSGQSGHQAGQAHHAQPGTGDALTVAERVSRVLSVIRPAVQADGGDIELAEITTDGTVRIRFHGACVGCPSSSATLRLGIERNLREHVPEVKKVEEAVR
jgi:Fe-S cluster biogenesis protein NfuA